MVMGDTLAGPGGDAALVRVHGTQKALAISTDVTPRYCFADPIEGGKQAVAEAYRNISATGATPLAITNCLNFGNPERAEIMGQFVGCLEGMGDAGRSLDFPVVSGNVSLYNETNGTGILPTPAIGGVGLLKQHDKAVGNRFTAEGQIIYVAGRHARVIGVRRFISAIYWAMTACLPRHRSTLMPRRRMALWCARRLIQGLISLPPMTSQMAAWLSRWLKWPFATA